MYVIAAESSYPGYTIHSAGEVGPGAYHLLDALTDTEAGSSDDPAEAARSFAWGRHEGKWAWYDKPGQKAKKQIFQGAMAGVKSTQVVSDAILRGQPQAVITQPFVDKHG